MLQNERFANLIDNIFESRIKKEKLYKLLYDESMCDKNSSNGSDPAYLNRLFNGNEKMSDSNLKAIVSNLKSGGEELNVILEGCDLAEYVPQNIGKYIRNLNGTKLLAFLFVHILRNTIIVKQSCYTKPICVGRIEENKVFKEKVTNQHYAIVNGKRLSGKTEFVLSFLKNESYMINYHDCRKENTKDHQADFLFIKQTLESMRISEDDFLDKDLLGEDYEGYSKRSGIEKLEQVDSSILQAIVFDNFEGKLKELDEFKKMAEKISVAIIVIMSSEERNNDMIVLGTFSDDELQKIFQTISGEKIITESVKEISKKLMGQAWLMSIIAKWFKYRKNKYGNKVYKELEQLNKDMDKNNLHKIIGDEKYRISTQGLDLKLKGHVKSVAKTVFKEFSPTEILLLSCLSEVEMPVEYILRWLNISPDKLQDLYDAGFCLKMEENKNIKIRVPKLVATLYLAQGDRKAIEELNKTKRFIENIRQDFQCKELGFTDKKVIYKITTNILMYSIDNQEYVKRKSDLDKYKEQVKEFYKDCIRYFQIQRDPFRIEELVRDYKKHYPDDESLDISLLSSWSEVARGYCKPIIDFENKYLKPVIDKDFSESVKGEKECLNYIKVNIDVLWCNLERNRLDSLGKEKEIEEYEKIKKVLIAETVRYYQYACRTEDDVFSKNRYVLQTYILLEVWSALYSGKNIDELKIYYEDLYKMYCKTQSEASTHLEILEMVNFLLDMIFITSEYLRVLEKGNFRTWTMYMFRGLQRDCKNNVESLGNNLSPLLIAKGRLIYEFCEKINAVIVGNFFVI